MTRLLRAPAVWLALAAAGASAAPVKDPLERPALMSPRASAGYLTSVARAGERLVAVGERGIVLLSDDHGATWRQSPSPVSVTLTAASFVSARKGWVTGHAGVVLATDDGGTSWRRVLDGNTAARLAFEAARARSNVLRSIDGVQGVAEAQQVVEDGPDKPFLDVHFDDEKTGWIVGAYGFAFMTEDAGASWKSIRYRFDNPKALHLYAIRRAGPNLYVAGEQGLVFRSADGGRTFARVSPGYGGTLFAIGARGAELVVAGLRGNAFRSLDGGVTFAKIEGFAGATVNAIAPLSDGTLAALDQGGSIRVLGDSGSAARILATVPGAPSNSLVQAADGTLVAVGMRGARRVPIEAAAPRGAR